VIILQKVLRWSVEVLCLKALLSEEPYMYYINYLDTYMNT
jgi:hypothetical protein